MKCIRAAKNKQEIEEYRQKIFKSKEECRKLFAKLPFDKKLKIVDELVEFANIIKSSKSSNKKMSKTPPGLLN
ncbi:MAG: hypothetical protein COY53_02115 [Elusimicrobia bacterium CG_4_10_14_0_8_um_filter_37_32]|nr:MAG: hypothetical protein COY53_02115 [Elusimicrobia bacterium CG_4_10_14_0_8_um_filter_37_32]